MLYIGAENWPFPIPLISKNGAWYFDSKTGRQEILFRRIGENEAVAIQACEESAITKKDQGTKPVSYDPITQLTKASYPLVQRTLTAMTPLPSTDTTFDS